MPRSQGAALCEALTIARAVPLAMPRMLALAGSLVVALAGALALTVAGALRQHELLSRVALSVPMPKRGRRPEAGATDGHQ